MVNDQPVNRRLSHAGLCLFRVDTPVRSQPSSMRQGGLTCVGNGWCPLVLYRQRHRLKTLLAYPFQQIARMLAADESALRSAFTQGICQRQATHHMAGANLERGIGTKNDF